MASENVETILRGIQIGQQRKSDRERQGLEQQRIDAEAEARKQAHEIALKQLDLNERHTNAVIDQLKAAAALKVLEARQSAVQNLAQGIPVAGATSQPGMDNLGNPVPRTLPSGASTTPVQQNITMPEALGGGTEVAPTPTEFAKGQANLTRIAKAPEVEAKLKEQQALQDAETQRQIAVAQETGKQRLTEIAATGDIQKTLTKMREDAENTRASLQRGTQMAIAKLPYSFFAQTNTSPEQASNLLQPYAHALYSGGMSIETLKKEFANKGLSGAESTILKTVMENGGIPLTDKQVQQIQGLQPVVDVVANMDKLLKSLPQTNSYLESIPAGAKTNLDPNVNGLYKQLESQIGNVAKSVSGDAGQRLQKALLDSAHGGYMPGRYTPTPANVQVRDNFVKEINSIVDAALKGLPDKQRAVIKDNMGLTKIQPLSFVQQQGQQTQTPTVYNWTPQGLVPAGSNNTPQSNQSTAKAFPKSRLKDFATANHISEQQAEEALKLNGYAIQ